MSRLVRMSAKRGLVAVGIAIGVACGGETTSGPTVDVSSIEVAPASVTVGVGHVTALSATPKSANGSPVTGREVQWSSKNSSVATVSTQGVVTGVAPGTTTVTASAGTATKDVPVTVADNAAASLSIIVPASSASAGASISPAVQVRLLDAGGNLTTSTASVSLTLSGGAANGTLAGQATVAAVSGVATFSGLSIDRKGTGYRLIANASGLQATSTPFDVVAGPAASVNKLTGDGQTTVAGTAVALAPSVKVVDAQGNAVNGITVSFAVANGGGSVTGASPTTDANGVATVGSWIVGSDMGLTTLTASAGSASTSFTATVTGATTPGVRLVVGALGSSSSASVSAGQDITIPITLDLTNRGADDIASISLTLNWDATRLAFKSQAAGNWTDSQGAPASITINTAGASSGAIRILGFTTSQTVVSAILNTFTFTAAGASSAPVNVTASISVAGNAAGSVIPVLPRPLSVTVTP